MKTGDNLYGDPLEKINMITIKCDPSLIHLILLSYAIEQDKVLLSFISWKQDYRYTHDSMAGIDLKAFLPASVVHINQQVASLGDQWLFHCFSGIFNLDAQERHLTQIANNCVKNPEETFLVPSSASVRNLYLKEHNVQRKKGIA